MELENKTILFLGSSVTYGSAANGVSFADILKDSYGVISVKEAVSGTTIADINERSYVSRLKKVDTDMKPDLFVCQLSTNDATKKIEESKIRDGIVFIIEYAKNTFGCPIAFYTGTYYESKEYARMIDLLYDLKKEYDFLILDLYNDEAMRKISAEDYKKYMKDPIHPNLLGYTEWWTPKFVDFLTQI